MFAANNMNGTDEIIKEAARSGWEAAMLAAIIIAMVAGITYLLKSWLGQATVREDRMAKRIDSLEDYQRTELHGLAVQCRQSLDANSQAVANASASSSAALEKVTAALETRPCFWSQEKQEAMLKRLEKQTA